MTRMCGLVTYYNYKYDEAGHKCVAIVHLDWKQNAVIFLGNQKQYQWLRM